MSETTAYVGLGSNLGSQRGSPAETLLAALARLEKPGDSLGQIIACSSFYETDPVGERDQPLFVNAVLALKTGLAPLDLLHELLDVEREFGRRREISPPKGPRTLDLDLLLIDDLELHLPELTLPHPALARRRFVLAPLAEIAPALRPPGFDSSIAGLLGRLPDEGENRISAVRVLAGAGRTAHAPDGAISPRSCDIRRRGELRSEPQIGRAEQESKSGFTAKPCNLSAGPPINATCPWLSK